MVVNKTFPTDYTTKSNPVDADLLIIADSEDGNEMKKITIGSITTDIGDGLIVDGSASSTTTYSSDKINTLNAAQDSTISGNYTTLNTNKLNKSGQLRTGNGAWKVTYNNGSGDETEVTLGSAWQALLSNGATSAPTFGTPTADINGQTEDTSWDMDADFLLAYDNSASANRKQKANVYRATSGEALAKTINTKFISPLQSSGILDIAYTDVTVSNTATETTLYSFSVPWNTLSTNRWIRLKMFLSLKKASTAAAFSLRFKYGWTTLVTTQINDATTFSTEKKWWVEFVVLASWATNTQEGSVVFNLVPDNAPATSAVAQYCMASVGTSAVDSTTSQNIVVTVQFGSASASDEAIMRQAILEKI